MAKADDKSSTVTWITLSVARDLAIPVFQTARYAEPEIVKWLYAKRPRWRYVKVYGLPEQGRSLEHEAQKLWATNPHRVLVEWKEGFAYKPTRLHLSRQKGKRFLGYIIVVGIEIAREDLERELKVLKRDDVADAQAAPAIEPQAIADSSPPLRHGPQFDRAIRALRDIYPPDGKAPVRFSVKAVHGKVAKHLAPESKMLGKKNPSEDVVGAAMKYLGRFSD
jgi:hypothetical protein